MKSGDMMIITTAFDETEELIIKAKELSESLQVPYMARNKKTVKYLLEHVDPHIFVVNNQRGLSSSINLYDHRGTCLLISFIPLHFFLLKMVWLFRSVLIDICRKQTIRY